MKSTFIFIFLCVTLLFFHSCDHVPAKREGGLVTPALVEPGKTDMDADEVTMRGRISFGGEVFGEFITDNQLDGWFFTARGGAVVTIDNSNLGTTRQLDSTLFLYGPKNESGFYGNDPIALDDDSGWGAHARLKAVTLPEDGEYLIVMGTYLNIDRGSYRLTLSCEGDQCHIPCDESCPSEDPCSGVTCSHVDGCIASVVAPSCSTEKSIVVSRTELITAEGLEQDTFTVHLTQEPSSHVTLWVLTNNNSETAVFPQRLLFCTPGFVEKDNGCLPLKEGDETPEIPSWQQEITVTVTGMNDQVADEDTPFTLTFEVESADDAYLTASPPPLRGINLDGDRMPDYDALDGLTDDELLHALQALTRGHTAYGYLGQNSIRTIMFNAVDVRHGMVESIYTGERIPAPRESVSAYQAGFNTEHSWPQGQFQGEEPMKSDLHHIYPTDIATNGRRSSYDYGMTSSESATYSLLGYSPSGTQIFQVRPDRRGDVARAHFYMVARYRGLAVGSGTFDDNAIETDGCINDREEAILRQWHIEDPVDDLERARNNRVEGYQGNRNPFIDRPDLVDRITDF